MIVVDLRGQDRASGAILGTAHIPAMDLLKEIGAYVEKFRHQPIVAFFCQYSAHRAPTVAGCICSNCFCFCFWFGLVYHGLPPFKSIQERHFPEGKTKATRSPTSSERAARPSRASWCLKEASGDGRPMTSLSSRWRRQCLRWRVTSWP